MIPLGSHGASEMACCGALDYRWYEEGHATRARGAWTPPRRLDSVVVRILLPGRRTIITLSRSVPGRLGRARLL
jgi:hypothetical protein